LHFWKAEYFCVAIWTTQISLKLQEKLDFRRTISRRPAGYFARISVVRATGSDGIGLDQCGARTQMITLICPSGQTGPVCGLQAGVGKGSGETAFQLADCIDRGGGTVVRAVRGAGGCDVGSLRR
jgi:hypothetical protein